MVSIVVAFAKLENGRRIRNALLRKGIEVTTVCTKGGQVIRNIADNPDSIVISGFRFSDMHYWELREYLPKDCKMLVITSHENGAEIWEEDVDVMIMPLKMQQLVAYVEECQEDIRRRRQKRRIPVRSAQDQNMINEAKRLLQLHNNLTEEEAHSYLQKRSMDSGLNLVETSRMIIDSYECYE